MITGTDQVEYERMKAELYELKKLCFTVCSSNFYYTDVRKLCEYLNQKTTEEQKKLIGNISG